MKLTLGLVILIFICQSCNKRPAGLDKRLKTYKYPYKTKLFKFLSQTKKLEMAYMKIDPTTPQDNKTVILVHGKNFSGAYFETLANYLKDKGYTIIIPDLIGFGRSSKPIDYQYNFQDLALSIKKLLEWYKIKKVSILGHSMGGMVATRFSLMFPNNVEQLILLNPIGLEDYKVKVPYQAVDIVYANLLKQKPEDIKNYQLKNYYDSKWDSKYDRWLSLQTGWIKGTDWRELAYISALTHNMIYTQPVYYEFKNLLTKTHLILGDRDKSALGKNLVAKDIAVTLGDYKKMGVEVSKLIPNSQLYFIEGIGHLPHIEDFTKLEKILETIF